MKRIVAIATAALLLVALAIPTFAAETATEDTDAYQIYEAAVAKINKASSLGMQGRVNMEMSSGGDAMTMEQGFLVRQVIHEDDRIDMEMIMGDGDEALTMYYKDNYVYMIDPEGKKIKMAMSPEEIMDALDESGMLELMEEDDIFELVRAETLDSGKTIVQFRMQGDLIADLANSLYESMELDASIDALSTVIYTYIVDEEGNLEGMRMHMDMEVSAADETVSVKTVTTMAVVSVDQYREIPFPADLNLYVETAA